MKKFQRLTKNNDFQALYHEGTKARVPGLVLYFLQSKIIFPRMGVIISRKMGKAVERNCFKRRMRTFFELTQSYFPVPFDCLWIATHPSVVRIPFSELQVRVREGLEKLIRKLPVHKD